MAKMLEVDFIDKFAEEIDELGYKVTLQPTGIPGRRLWQNDPASLVRGPKYRPDILVERNGEFAIVEVKARMVLLGGVMQARKYADYFGVGAIVCVPDEAYRETPGSVTEFADDQRVVLCPLSKVGDALSRVIGQPIYNNPD